MRRALGALLLIALLGLVACGSTAPTSGRSTQRGSDNSSDEVNLDPAAVAKARAKAASTTRTRSNDGSRPQVVVAVPPGMASSDDEQSSASSSRSRSRPPTDAEIERDLSQFRKFLATIPPAVGKRAEVISTGEAAAPFDAPQVVIQVVEAANQIALTPYRWGGGHGAWRDKGYDCSGSVSFALAAAGLLNAPLDSTRFMSYGKAGPGKWITIYANAGHAFMTIAGLRFDTGGLKTGTRWQASMRPTDGFVARHPAGL